MNGPLDRPGRADRLPLRPAPTSRAGHTAWPAFSPGFALRLGALGFLLATSLAAAAQAEPLRIVATTPELGSIARIVGGDDVVVEVLVKPTEDPHFAEARPSFIKLLSEADLVVHNGMELEVGYLPVLLENSRNSRVLPGAKGNFDASTMVTPLEAPTTQVDRSMGDVHPTGNPHFLLDPVNGVRVAGGLAERLADLRPASREGFASRFESLRKRIGDALVGPVLAAKYDPAKLALLFEKGRLRGFLESQGDVAALGGWLGLMLPHQGARVVDDHPTWPYFAERFGLVIAGHLEPKPGVPPTTKHLGELVDLMRADGIRVVLANAYYDPRYADFVAANTGARVLRMANQAGALPGTEDYVAQMDYNVRQVAGGLAGSAAATPTR